jgi:acetyltransferase-like isoleucine patch superfamily enzyme
MDTKMRKTASEKMGNFKTIADCIFGKNVKLVEPYNLYGCEIGDGSFVGPFTEIQNGVKIGNNTTISSHTFVCTFVEIGNDCFVGHGVMFTNDRLLNEGNSEKTKIGNNVKIGSNATILPVTIGDNAVIGAGAIITKDIPPGAVVYGEAGQIRRKL